MLPKESAFVSFPGPLSLYLLLQHVFLHSLLLHAQDLQLPWHTEKKKLKNSFAFLLAASWGTPLMDIPSERNMKLKEVAKMGNYQKYLLFYTERRKILCAPNTFCLSRQPKDIWANKSHSSSRRHSAAAADELLGLPQTYLTPGKVSPPTGF